MSGSKKVFQTRKYKNRVVTFIVAFIFSTILSIFLIGYVLDMIYDDPQLYFYPLLIISVLIGIGASILFVVADKLVTIEIDDDSFTYTKGKKVEKYLLEEYAGTNVVNNYENGGYIGSDRYFKFIRSDGTIRQIDVPFKEEAFSEIASLIVKNKRADNDTEEVSNEIRDSFDGGKRIEIPKDEFNHAFKRSGYTRGIISIIIAVISVVVCIVAYLKLDLLSFIAIAFLFGCLGITLAVGIYLFGRKETKQALFGCLGILLAVGIYLYGRKETKQALADTPAFVLVEPYCLTFENKRYDASEITRIVASPAAYDTIRSDRVAFRTVVITDRTNNKHTYYFGRAPKDNKKMVFGGYQDLVGSLDSWCFANHIEFRLDLG